MALTVGTDSYISVSDANSYISLAGLADLSDAELSLKRATLALDRLYGNRFIGIKSTLEQALHWPRRPTASQVSSSQDWFVTDSFGNYRSFSGIPVEIAQATAELAVLIESGVDLYSQPEPVVTQEMVEVDVIKQSRTFGERGYQPNFLYKISTILAPLLQSAAGLKLVR